MNLFSAAILLFIHAVLQPPLGGGGLDGPSPSGGAISVTATASASGLPIGKSVTLTCTHDPLTNVRYQWEFQCNTSPWSVPANWNTKVLALSCLNSEGTLKYKVTVTGKNSSGIPVSGTASVTVKVHAPNEVDLKLEKTFTKRPLNPPVAEQWFQNSLVTLSWNGEKLGSCAWVCCQEVVTTTYKGPFSQFNRTEYLWPRGPNACLYDSQNKKFVPWQDPTNPPNTPSWHWDSPTLMDCHAVKYSQRHANWLNQQPTGTEVGSKRHQYLFRGKTCGAEGWELKKTYYFKCFVRVIKVPILDDDGEETGKTEEQKVPVWELVE